MNDRAKYIQLGVANGVTSLDTIKKVYKDVVERAYPDNNDKNKKNK